MLMFTLCASAASAHLAGTPPFFEINGKLAAQYNVPSTSLEDFPLPQDIGIDRYLVNTKIEFHIKSEIIGVPPDVAKDTVFEWDFGDGTKATGLSNSHIYKTPGSYTISIDAVYQGDAALIESARLQVLPNSEYKLPVAVLTVNGSTANDPLVNVLHFPFNKNMHFDSNKSIVGNGKITAIRWDFGDGEQSNKSSIDHMYRLDSDMVFPVLRVEDENGFISDTFAQIDKSTESESTVQTNQKATVDDAQKKPSYLWVFWLAIIVAGGFLLKFIVSRYTIKK